MKKALCLFLALTLLLPVLSFSASGTSSNMPDPSVLNGYENVCLTYTFDYYGSNDLGAHTVEDLLPYVGYYNRDGKLTDYFFDSFLFLPCVSFGPSGGSMVGSFDEPSNLVDWKAYIDDTFRKDRNVDALNTAFAKVKSELGDKSDRKAGVFFTILYPIHTQTSFGTIDGKNLDFSNNEDRKLAIKWMIDEQLARYRDGGYENLDVVGFYWFEEYLFNYEYTAKDIELFKYTSDYLHSLGLKFIWIPWYRANGCDRVDELGIDVACMQPNLFWLDTPDYDRVKDSLAYSNQYGLGMEVEVDWHAFGSDDYRERYFRYLEDGMKYGAMDSVKMYYQNKKPAVYAAAQNSKDFNRRIIYDLTYKYAKGTLTQFDIDNARNGTYPQDEVKPTFALGDINCDGDIDQYDYLLVKRHYFSTRLLTIDEQARADVNKDGAIDQYDYILLKRNYFGTYVIN